MAVTPKKTLYMFSLGGRESSVLLEQRVHHEPDQRQRSKDSANYVPRFVPQLKNPLEQVSSSHISLSFHLLNFHISTLFTSL